MPGNITREMAVNFSASFTEEFNPTAISAHSPFPRRFKQPVRFLRTMEFFRRRGFSPISTSGLATAKTWRPGSCCGTRAKLSRVRKLLTKRAEKGAHRGSTRKGQGIVAGGGRKRLVLVV